VGWMLLAALGIMWSAFLVPWGRRVSSESRSVNDFEHRMELLANAEVHGTTGRWIVTPRKGVRFLGPDDRRRARARERRRKVFVALLELIVLTSLIGLVPPLRAVWFVSAGLGAILIMYVWVLLSMKGRAGHPHERIRVVERLAPARSGPDGTADAPDLFDDLEPVHVVVREASVGV
jgi:hypothetical protein